jgi:hypothetical protein
MDSADQLELVSVLEDHLEVGIPDGRFMGLETVGDLIGAFTELRAAQPADGGTGPDDADGAERRADAR